MDSASNAKTLYLVLIAYGAALLTKATAVVLPTTLLVYDAIFHHRMIRRDHKLYAGMALMSGLYLWMILGGWEGTKIVLTGYLGLLALYGIPTILIAQIWPLGAVLWVIGVTIWLAVGGSGPGDGGGMDGTNY